MEDLRTIYNLQYSHRAEPALNVSVNAIFQKIGAYNPQFKNFRINFPPFQTFLSLCSKFIHPRETIKGGGSGCTEKNECVY